jgi:ADP-ribose diphosphatase
MNHAIDLVLAEDLYEQRLVGDEPEQLEVIPWRLDKLHELVMLEECSEGRSLAALLIIKELMANQI